MISYNNERAACGYVLFIDEGWRISRNVKQPHQAQVQQIDGGFVNLITKKFIAYPLYRLKDDQHQKKYDANDWRKYVAKELSHYKDAQR